jgi:hypothetical protein
VFQDRKVNIFYTIERSIDRKIDRQQKSIIFPLDVLYVRHTSADLTKIQTYGPPLNKKDMTNACGNRTLAPYLQYKNNYIL